MDPQKPWKIKVIDSLGLKSVVVKKYVFRPPKPGIKSQYQMEYDCDKMLFNPIIKGKKIDISQDNINAYVLQQDRALFVPLIHLKSTPALSKCSSGEQEVRDRVLILFSHGNASDLGDVYYFGDHLVQEYNVDFIGYDYTGYGYGLGRYETSEKQTYDDLQAVLSFSVHKLNYSLNQIVLWGFSLGSGPTTELGARYPSLRGIVLQAPLASLYLWLGRKHCAYDVDDMYQNINKIQAVKSRILLMHGMSDDIIDVKHCDMLYEKYLASNKQNSNICMIKIKDIKHNDLQLVIEQGDNQLAYQVHRFLHMPANNESDERETTLLKLVEVNEYEPFISGYKSQIHQKRPTQQLIQEKKIRFGLCICSQD